MLLQNKVWLPSSSTYLPTRADSAHALIVHDWSLPQGKADLFLKLASYSQKNVSLPRVFWGSGFWLFRIIRLDPFKIQLTLAGLSKVAHPTFIAYFFQNDQFKSTAQSKWSAGEGRIRAIVMRRSSGQRKVLMYEWIWLVNGYLQLKGNITRSDIFPKLPAQCQDPTAQDNTGGAVESRKHWAVTAMDPKRINGSEVRAKL